MKVRPNALLRVETSTSPKAHRLHTSLDPI